jgi:hypothetical protein
MDGFQGVVHGCGQVIPDCIQVRGVFQAGRECGDSLVGVIPGTVEPPVHHPLHPPPQWIESATAASVDAATATEVRNDKA